MKIKFSKQAQKAFELIEKTRLNLFITGKAGTGKSTLLDYLRKNVTKKTIILAPTGIAAVNVNGDTIHSFFALKPGYEKEEAREMKFDKYKQKKFKEIETICIDEISMVRADLLDAVDLVLRKARKSDQAFGGVQMIFFGDLFQLPPVVTSNDKEKFYSEYDAPYFFDANVFKESKTLFGSKFKLKIIELTKIYRQKDRQFIEILNAIRNNDVKKEHFDILNQRCDYNFIPPKKKKYIHLMTTNAGAATINNDYLSRIKSEEVPFFADISGTINRNLYPNDTTITLKVGSQVMFISNDSDKRWVNGTLGKVIEIFEDEDDRELVVMVEKEDGEIVEVTRHTWEISKYVFKKGQFEREKLGSFLQLPIKLAWAITIHKSQGKTFDNVIIDLERGSFAHGQTYVALSRCRSLNGIVLRKPIYKNHIIMDERVKNFK